MLHVPRSEEENKCCSCLVLDEEYPESVCVAGGAGWRDEI